MAIAVGQFTIYDFHDVYSATTPPTNPQKNQVWLDTSATPPVMKTWNGTEWLVANDYVSGGTNLLYNTGKMKDTSYWYINKATGTAGLELVDDSEVGKAIKFTIGEDVTSWCYFGNNSYQVRKFEIGQDYTISFLAKADDVRKINLTFQNGTATAKAIHFGDVMLNTGWQRYEVTAKATSIGDENLLYIVAPGAGNRTIYMTKLQLETGNRASDWSQAPEDIEKELIRVESKVEVNADAILQKVSKTDYTGNTIVSMINQTAESVKISAKNIELNGAVTFSSFDSSTQSKITNIENTANNASSAANTAQQTANSAVDKIDNLEIGSRNYILNSNFATGNLYKWNTNYGTVTIVDDSLLRVKAARVVTTAASQGLFQTVSNSIALFESDYAASVFVKGTAGQVVKLSFESAVTYSHTLSGDWDVIEVTMPRSKYGSWNKTITLYSGSAQTFYATKFLLTTGNKILDWMPAPEDTELEVTNAKNIANNAAQTATTAKSTADSASSTANTASSNASTALSTANTAKTTATNAQSTASTANTNATTAINTANNANSTASTANNTANTAKSTADSAKTKAEEADSKIESLEIGGTNLIRIGTITNSNSTSTYDSSTNTWTITAEAGKGGTWGCGLAISNKHKVLIPYGRGYILSFEIKVPRACSWNIDVNNYPTSGSYWSNNDNDLTSKRKTSLKTLTPNQWVKCWSYWENAHSGNADKLDLYDNSNFGIVMQNETSNMVYQIRNIKGELGNKPTQYSPAPEDVELEINNAQNAASNAQQTANTANSNANSAISTANTAKSTADSASSTANTAKTTADSAKSTATTAQSTASQAQSAANTANTNATTAVNTANNASSAASTAQSTANTAKSTADSAKTEAANANSKVDNIKVGGSNLASKSTISSHHVTLNNNGYTYTFSTNSISSGIKISKDILEENKEYVLSYKARVTDGTISKLGGHCRSKNVSCYLDDVLVGNSYESGFSFPSDNNIHNIRIHFTPSYPSDSEDKNVYIQPNRGGSASQYTIEISEIQLEKGNKATGWKPSQADVDLEINNAQNAANNAQSTANTANGTATMAKNTADTANSNASSALTKADNATTAANNAVNTANNANSTAASANSKIDNLEFGGRNLLKNTALKNTTGWSLTSGVTLDKVVKCGNNNTLKYNVTGLTADTWRAGSPDMITINPSKKYSASCEYYIPTDHGINSGASLEIQWFNDAGTRVGTRTKALNTGSLDVWQVVKLENVTPSSGAVKANARVWVRQNGKFWVGNIKFEEGTKASAWSASQEDIDLEINNAQNTANNAQNAANSANTAAGNAQNTANNAQSSANTANNKLDSWSYPTDKTTINGGKIMTGSVTAKQIAAQTITADKLRVGDFNNLVQIHPDLNPNGNAVFTSNGVNYFKIGQGGYAAIVLFRSFNLDFVQNDEYSFIYTGYKDSNITGVSLIARYFYTDSTWNNAGHANLSMENSVSTKTVTLKITAKPTAGKILKEIRFFMEKDNTTTGYYYLTDMQLYKKGKGSLIVDGSIEAKHLKAGAITADIITSGTFKGTNFEAGGSGVSGLILAKDDSDDITFSASKNGVFAKNITFVDTVNFDGTFTTSRKSVLNSNGLTYSKGESSSSYSSEDEVSIGASGVVVKNTYSSSGGSDSITSTTITNNSVATGTLTANGNVESKGFISSAGNITSQGGIFGTTFIQHSANYGTPLEVGQYIDLHSIGSKNDVDVRLDTGGTRDRLRISGGADLSRYVEIGMNSNGSFLRDSPSGKYIQLRTDRLTYDGATVPHNWRQNFTPFIFSDTGNFNMVESWGEAVYLGDLVWIRGRVRGSRGGHSGSVYIGGLPVSCIAGYPALDIAFFGGVTASLGNGGFDIRAYLEGNASHSIITYSNKDTGGWHNLQCSHVTTGNMDISFSATYRWR